MFARCNVEVGLINDFDRFNESCREVLLYFILRETETTFVP